MTAVLESGVALTEAERLDLEEQEGAIATARHDIRAGTFRIGVAFRTVRDGRLYRESHETFEEYAKERHRCSASRAYQLIDHATTVEVLVSTVVETANFVPTERVTRELHGLTDVEKRMMWADARARAGSDTAITSGVMRAVVEENDPPLYEDDADDDIDAEPDVDDDPDTPTLSPEVASEPAHLAAVDADDATEDEDDIAVPVVGDQLEETEAALASNTAVADLLDVARQQAQALNLIAFLAIDRRMLKQHVVPFLRVRIRGAVELVASTTPAVAAAVNGRLSAIEREERIRNLTPADIGDLLTQLHPLYRDKRTSAVRAIRLREEQSPE